MAQIIMDASSGPGVVVLVLDPSTAREFADAWELANASGAVHPARAEFLLEVAGIKRAAINADRLSDDLPAPVDVAAPRRLSLVGDL